MEPGLTATARQSLKNLKAEVDFRRFHEEAELDPDLLDYIRKAAWQRTGLFTHLLLRGHTLSPFIELGCETAANGLVLTNRLGQRGISVDISLAALKAVDNYRRELGFDRLPLRVCCDIHDLPVRSNVLRMALGWGVLHHFPDPRLPLFEVKRALARTGLFYFNGEPVRRVLSLNLRSSKSIIHMNPLARLLLRLRILPWLWAIDGAEAIEAGALEMKFSAWQWKRFIPDVFEDVQFRWLPYLTSDIYSVSAPVRWLTTKLLGLERAEKLITALAGGVAAGEAYKRPDLTARRLPSSDGMLRLAINKQQHSQYLTLRFSPAAGSSKMAPPDLRIGTLQAELLKKEAPAGEYSYLLEPYTAADGVLELELSGLPEGVELQSIITYGDGGRIEAVWDQPVVSTAPTDVDPESLLACPVCKLPVERPTFAITEDRPPLLRQGEFYLCEHCGLKYPIVDGVALLLRPELAARMGYPAAER